MLHKFSIIFSFRLHQKDPEFSVYTVAQLLARSKFPLTAVNSVDFYCRKIKYRAITVIGRNITNSYYLLYLIKTDILGIQEVF